MAQSTFSLNFDGIDDAGSVILDLSSTPTLTLSFWMKVPAWASLIISFEFTANYNSNAGGFIIAPGGSSSAIEFGIGNSGNYWTDTFPTPSSGAWHHYALEMDRTNKVNLAWVDGVSQTLTTSTHNAATFNNFANSTLNWMCRNGASLFGAALLDDVGIWTTLLSGATISGLAAGTTDPSTLSPFALWRLEDGTGNNATDSSGNGHTTTLAGSPTWSTDVPSQLAGSNPVAKTITLYQSVVGSSTY